LKIYAETSAVLRWLFNEEGGDAILELLRSTEKVLCSRLTLVESRRSIRRAVVLQEIAEAEGAELLAVLSQAASRWALLEVSADVARRAEQPFPVEPIRTLDALHLGSALVLREAIGELAVVSTDARIRSNALQLGFEVRPE
jgi:predicted nucleic acid-binding protein